MVMASLLQNQDELDFGDDDVFLVDEAFYYLEVGVISFFYVVLVCLR